MTKMAIKWYLSKQSSSLQLLYKYVADKLMTLLHESIAANGIFAMGIFFIVISAEAVDVSDDGEVITDVMWPTPEIKEQAELFKSTVPFASVMIPGDLIQRRGMASGIKLLLSLPEYLLCLISSVNRVALIANTAYRNIASILPTSVNV